MAWSTIFALGSGGSLCPSESRAFAPKRARTAWMTAFAGASEELRRRPRGAARPQARRAHSSHVVAWRRDCA
eukprot:scaffold35393_cov31-Tisochrysis_lutea.AAC.1